MKINELKGNPKNPRKITDKQLEKLKKSLNEFGDLSGIVFNRITQQLVGGHQRVKALPQDAIIEKIEHKDKTGTVAIGHVIIDGIKHNYREVEWDELREKAANLAANQHGGEFDMPAVNEWLLELKSNNFDIDLTGFDVSDIVEPTKEGLVDEDQVPEVVDTRCKKGDIWKLGNHRLMCGDSTNIQHVEKLMNGEKAEVSLTDPPYGISYQSNYRKDKFDVIENDDVILNEWSGCANAVVNSWIIFFCAWQRLSEWLDVGKQFGDLTNILIWKKSAAMGDLKGSFSPNYEMALAYNRGGKLGCSGRPSAIIEQSIDSAESFVHPTQKPVSLFEKILDSLPNGSVLDLFGGSGSTLIACEKTNRKCFMMELDEHYCDVIFKRWEDFTGQKAELIKNIGA